MLTLEQLAALVDSDEIDTVIVAITDMQGRLQGKRFHARHFLDEPFPVEDDHMHFMNAGIPSVDLIDLDYLDWHTAGDTLDKVSAASLQVVGDVVLAALPEIEARLAKSK